MTLKIIKPNTARNQTNKHCNIFQQRFFRHEILLEGKNVFKLKFNNEFLNHYKIYITHDISKR